MINVSQDFMNAMKAPVKVLNATVVTSAGATYTAKDALQAITLKSAGYYYGANTRSATLKMLGTSYALIDKRIQISVGVQTSQQQNLWETINYGTFTVYEQEVNLENGTTTIKAYDDMGIFGRAEYQGGELEFPCTVAEMAEQVATKMNVELATDFTGLPNANYQITEDLYANINGKTYRDILAEIAGATATMAKINMGGQLVFYPLASVVSDSWTYTQLIKLKLEPKYGPVNSIVLSRTPQEDNIAVMDEESVTENGLTEVKLANNEILDDDRQSLAQPLLDASKGFSFHPSTITTVGLGWTEVGDRVKIADDDGNEYETVITDSTITVTGGIKETLASTAPDETQTNYALAGGITKTIYNTEIKVDKQNQEIQSIVEEQTQFEDQTQSNFTNITQNISSVITSVQNSGGNNLIKNSAMYAKGDDGAPLHWTFSETGTWSTTPSADASANGSLSGQVITLKGENASQTIIVKPDNDAISENDKTYYSFSCRIKKTAVGSCSIALSDGTQEGVWVVSLANGESAEYKEFAIEAMLPHSTELTLTVQASDDAEFYITDMMLAVGNYRTQWTQANGEFSNSQVQIDAAGVTVKNSNLDGAYTKQTPQEVEVWKNNQLAAVVSSDTISAPVGGFKKEIDMPPIKIVAQSDGWAFVEEET